MKKIPAKVSSSGCGAPLFTQKMSTEELAATLKVRPQTIRAGLCNHGHYFGLRPLKLPNGRLLWDSDAVEALTSGEPKNEDSPI